MHCLSNEEYDFLYVLLLVQMYRSPIVRTTLQAIHQQLNAIVASTIGYKPENDIDDNHAKALSLESIFNKTEPLLGIISKRFFILQQTKNETSYFITSDNAVLLIGHAEYEPVSLKSSFTEIYFPLSPNYSLSLLPQVICDEIKNKKISSMKEIANAVIKKEPLSLDIDNVIYLNFAQVNQSKRFLYSKYELSHHLEKDLKFIPERNEKKSLYKIGNEALRSNVRKNAHIVLLINSNYYDFDIHEYTNSEVNLELLVSLKTNVLDKYLHLNIPLMYIYDNQYAVRMIRNIEIVKIEHANGLYYYQIKPEINFPIK